MKKILFITLSAAILFGCIKPELEVPTVESAEYNTVLTATMPSSKVSIDNECTKLTWSNGDRISVLTSKGVYKDFVYEGEDGVASAQFQGMLEDGESVAGYAIYPANSQHSLVDGTPQIYLPDTYEWKDGQVMGPMAASIEGETASFLHAGGLFVFDVKNVPSGATEFRFKTVDKVVTGSFAYDEKLVAGEGEADQVSFSFNALSKATDMKFYVPVPTGSYTGFTISYVRGASDCEIKSASSTNEIVLTTAKMFEAVIEGGSLYVTEAGSADADGYGWATATTLSNALAKANDGDIIYVGAGTYIPETFISGKAVTAGDAGDVVAEEVTVATGDAQKAFIVNKNVTVIGGYPANGGDTCDPVANKTILSGGDLTNHVVVVSAPKTVGKTVRMSGFTVTGASSNKTDDVAAWQINETILDDYTGAMAAVGTSLSLENMTFTGNNTENASAIYGANSVVDIKNCVFTGNAASSNGTVWFSDGSELIFADSEISNNTANNAAGLYLYLSEGKTMTANVSDVTIKDNKATSRGGAMYLRTATAGQTLSATIDRCTMQKNTSATGASICILNASGMTISNCNVSENDGTGTSEGGAFYSLDASNSFTNCSFVSNTAKANGAFLIQSNAVVTTNLFDGCEWSNNINTAIANMYVYGKATDNNVVITNSLFNANSVKGRGGAIYARANGVGKVDCKCVNTTFYANEATSRGTAVLAYSNNTSYYSNVDMISCTVYSNSNSGKYDAVTAETDNVNTNTATINLCNTLIEGNVSTADNTQCYDLSAYKGGRIVEEKCQSKGANDFDYATMLGALTTDGVCPLLLPDTNPAYTGGMTSEELSALASTNVPATVLTKDQLGNDRTGTVIGAWTPAAN